MEKRMKFKAKPHIPQKFIVLKYKETQVRQVSFSAYKLRSVFEFETIELFICSSTGFRCQMDSARCPSTLL